jgi:hypothetical protein
MQSKQISFCVIRIEWWNAASERVSEFPLLKTRPEVAFHLRQVLKSGCGG